MDDDDLVVSAAALAVAVVTVRSRRKAHEIRQMIIHSCYFWL